MNDPHGIVWDGTEYHMFFQYAPDSLTWQSNIEWGHAVSTDLIHWRHVESLLIPENEVGCWSGSAISLDDGYLIYYTRPSNEDWSKGQVVVAKANRDFSECVRVEPPVIQAAPGDEFIDFRDPQVRRVQGGYLMTVGAGIKEFGGCALQYSSNDGFHWQFDQVLASRSMHDLDPIPTGTVWECPQFVELETKSCLIVSSINPETYQQVQYALGTADSNGFHPEKWGNLGFSAIPYATTTFQDNNEQKCLMSWLKESRETSEYSGAQSVPLHIKESQGQLVLELHPNLIQSFKETHKTFVSGSSWLSLSGCAESTSMVLRSQTDVISIQITDRRIEIAINNEVRMYAIEKNVSRAEILIDADILEFILPDTPMALALRIPPNDQWDVADNSVLRVIKRNYWGE